MKTKQSAENVLQPIFDSLEKSDIEQRTGRRNFENACKFNIRNFAAFCRNNRRKSEFDSRFAESHLKILREKDYLQIFLSQLENEIDFAQELANFAKNLVAFFD